MTSMPASRSARAMIFAPRSWPSSPGLATTTRILRVCVLFTAAADLMGPARREAAAVLRPPASGALERSRDVRRDAARRVREADVHEPDRHRRGARQGRLEAQRA